MRVAPLLASLLLCFTHLAVLADPPFLSQTQRMLVPSNPARLVISRDRNAPTACDVTLLVDGQINARVALGETVELQVPTGEVGLLLNLEQTGYCAQIALQNAQSILIEPGETRHFQLVYSDDALFLAPQAN